MAARQPEDAPVSPAVEALRTFIRASIERLERGETGAPQRAEGLLFMGSWQDAMPRLLIEDPVLEPTDKVVWQVIRLKTEVGAAAAFPSYRHIGTKANIRSEATVSRAIAILRASRWLTLCARVRDDRGRFRGNVYVLHDEPLSLADTVYLDPDYMAFLDEATSHHHARVRQVAAAALSTIEDGVRAGVDVIAAPNALERRLEAAETLYGPHQGGFFSFNGARLRELGQADGQAPPGPPTSNIEDGVQDRKTPASKSEVGPIAGGVPSKFEVGGCSSSSIEKTITTTREVSNEDPPSDDLLFPERLNANLKALALIYLRTIPRSEHQAVLDELEGRLRAERQGAPPVYDPMRFLKKLCDTVQDGTFAANLGLAVRNQREQRRHIEARSRAIEVHVTADLPEPDPRSPLVQRVMRIRDARAARGGRELAAAAPTGTPAPAAERNCAGDTIGDEGETTADRGTEL